MAVFVEFAACVLCRRFRFQGLGGSATTAVTGSDSSAIRAEVQDPSPSVTSMGGKLVFSTSKQGTVNLADRMTIDNQVRTLAVCNPGRDFLD